MNAKHPIATDRQARSDALTTLIRSIINAEGDAIPFSRFMSLALYEPDLGYYMAPHEKFGPKGDFITAPLISPLYAQTLARSIIPDLTLHPHILEWGAGNGQLAKDMLLYLAEQGLEPSYAIYEISPACRAMQRETLAAWGDQVTWLEAPPTSFSGVIIANEVLDALPVDVFHYKNGVLFERAVTWVNDRFAFIDRVPHWDIQIPLSSPSKVDYISERHVWADDLLRTWLGLLKAGKIVMIDYGFLAHEYYHPERSRGTLMCHTQHQAHDDPFLHIGLQDITAHVNFSSLIEIATAAGLHPTLYTQAQYLVEHGLLDLAKIHFSENIAVQRGVSQAVRILLEPQEMGEFFKVCVIA